MADKRKGKYYTKNEVCYYTNPKFFDKNGHSHPVLVTLQYRNNRRINVITHSKYFFNGPTYPLKNNPNKADKKYGNNSRISIPHWDNKKYLKNKAYGYWHFSIEDRKTIKKINKGK